VALYALWGQGFKRFFEMKGGNMAENIGHAPDSSTTAAAGKKKKLKWEFLVKIDHGSMRPYEKLNRARFGNGWLVKYEFIGGSDKSGCSLAYVDDPQGLWVQDEKMRSKIINSQQYSSHFLVIRQFDAQLGSFVAVATGSSLTFLTQLLFVPSDDVEQQDIVAGGENDQLA
jgi:hypothetical protein